MDTYEKLLAPYQVQNGGNLILMQIENEFSSQRVGDCKTCPANAATIDYMEVWFCFFFFFLGGGGEAFFVLTKGTEIEGPSSQERNPGAVDAQRPKPKCERVEHRL